jgi:hypothetical protein
MPIYSLKEFLDTYVINHEGEGKLMPKEKGSEFTTKIATSEYIFRVENETEVDIERIARENPNREMIVVLPEGNDAYLLIDLDFQRKHKIIVSPIIIHTTGYCSSCINKASIPRYIERYNKAKAEKPKPKITVRVKTFGDTLPF